MVLSRARRRALGLAEFRTALKDPTALLGDMLPRTTHPPTMKAVAQLAGVSTMTVSRVVNGVEVVRPDTVARVRAAIEQLNYRPNTSARMLAVQEQVGVGVLYSNPSGGYLGEILVGLLEGAGHQQMPARVVLDKCPPGASEVERATELIASGLQGLVLPPPLSDNAELLDAVEAAGTPVALVASRPTGPQRDLVSTVTVDDAAAAQEMTRHLIGLGHRRIAFIRGPLSQAASRHRLEGFQRAMAAAGLVVEPELLVDGDFTYRSGLDAAERLLAQAQAPTAIFAANDDMAAASVAVAHQRGLHVPGDLSVVGFDDTAIATTVWPELTTIRQPIAEMSCRALQILVEQIHDQVNRHLISPENVVLGHSLVRRQSDAPPRVRPAVQA